MKYKNGFTLIELLAVIILLAVVSLILAPQVIDLVDRSAQSTFEESVQAAIRAAQSEYTLDDFEDWPSGGVDITTTTIPMKYIKSFKSGKFNKDSNNKITVVNLTDGKYCANGSKSDLTIKKGC